MYHITNNRRAIDSATRLRKGLDRLLSNYPFDSITISTLCIESGVSRPTFYRLFDTPADIIHWYCDCQSKELCREMKVEMSKGMEWPFKFNLRYILEHPEALKLAYKAHRLDIADASFYRQINPALFDLQKSHGLNDRDMRVSARIVSSVITAAVCEWMENCHEESIDTFYDRIVRIVHNIQ